MADAGLDVSGQSLVVYAVNERKRCVSEGTGAPTRAGLRALVQPVGVGTKLVAFEAGNQLKLIAETLKTMAGVPVHGVRPNEGKWITESRGKTDRVDAKTLAELARGGLRPRAGHVMEGPVRELRELVRARPQLQSQRIALLKRSGATRTKKGIGCRSSALRGRPGR